MRRLGRSGYRPLCWSSCFLGPILLFQDAKGAPTKEGSSELKQQLLPEGRQVKCQEIPSLGTFPSQNH